ILVAGKAEQAYKHGFCRGRSSLSSGSHPPPLAAYPGTARATPQSPYAALLQVALARFTPLARFVTVALASPRGGGALPLTLPCGVRTFLGGFRRRDRRACSAG